MSYGASSALFPTYHVGLSPLQFLYFFCLLIPWPCSFLIVMMLPTTINKLKMLFCSPFIRMIWLQIMDNSKSTAYSMALFFISCNQSRDTQEGLMSSKPQTFPVFLLYHSHLKCLLLWKIMSSFRVYGRCTNYQNHIPCTLSKDRSRFYLFWVSFQDSEVPEMS